MANQTKVIKMELTSGSVEYEEEMIKNRLEVAQVCYSDYILWAQLNIPHNNNFKF